MTSIPGPVIGGCSNYDYVMRLSVIYRFVNPKEVCLKAEEHRRYVCTLKVCCMTYSQFKVSLGLKSLQICCNDVCNFYCGTRIRGHRAITSNVCLACGAN